MAKNHTEETKAKIAQSMEGNNNAEHWTEQEAISFMDRAVILSKDETMDFIGEIAKAMDSYIDVFDYLVDKFPSLKGRKNRIKRNCEVNCFSNSKKGNIKEATAIMNLKSNHGWTDRNDLTGTMLNSAPLSLDEIKKARENLENEL